jgi:hypothetical protein
MSRPVGQSRSVEHIVAILSRDHLAPPAGFEPAAIGLEVRCSVQLSYEGVTGRSGDEHPITSGTGSDPSYDAAAVRMPLQQVFRPW